MMSARDPLTRDAVFAGKAHPRTAIRSEVKRLRRELAAGVSPERRAEIETRLMKLSEMQSSKKFQPKAQRSSVPVPRSYVDAMTEKRNEAHKVSDFKPIRARFLQGGAPGSGKN